MLAVFCLAFTASSPVRIYWREFIVKASEIAAGRAD